MIRIIPIAISLNFVITLLSQMNHTVLNMLHSSSSFNAQPHQSNLPPLFIPITFYSNVSFAIFCETFFPPLSKVLLHMKRFPRDEQGSEHGSTDPHYNVTIHYTFDLASSQICDL